MSDLLEKAKKAQQKTKTKEQPQDDLFESEEKPKDAKKTLPKKEPSNGGFDWSKHPVIVLFWGYDGTSKSETILKYFPAEKVVLFDLEDKLRPLAEKLGFPQQNLINARKYNEHYDVSGPKTLQGIRDILNQIKKDKQTNSGKFKDVELIAFDGISDIRKPFAVEEWLSEHPDRQRPMNWGDWGEINDKVRDICFTMINMGLVTNTHIAFTAQIDYKDDTEIPNCKPWIWHNIQHKFKMRRDDEQHRFYAFCEKSHFDPFFEIDLTDWTHKEKPSLINMLQSPETIRKYIELSKEEQKELVKQKSDELFGQ